jgi:hypothetical protein
MKLIITAIAAALLAAGAAALAAGPSQASVSLLSCTGTYQTTYTPGLTYTPQNVEFATVNHYSRCLLHPPVSSGSSQASGPIPGASCNDLLSGGDQGSTTVTWNTGQQTVYSWTAVAEEIGGNFIDTETGKATSGLFTGDTVVRQSVTSLSEINNGCNSPGGLTDETGAVTLLITG